MQQGFFNPTVAVDAGGGSGAWTNPTNVFLSDGVYANGNISGGGSSTNDLVATGFGFTIPSVATITGILMEVQRYGTNAQDLDVYLTKVGSISGSNKAAFVWPTSPSSYQSYGGSTDLWGTTWMPTDVNNSGFGAAIAAINTHGGGTALVDNIRITVYYVIGPLAGNIEMPKTYRYQIQDINGNYLGDLPNVITDLNFVHEINTAGSQTTITCAVSADTSLLQNGQVLTDESGATLTDENGNVLTTENAEPFLGVGSTSTIIKNGNKVTVIEYGYYHPDGIVMFRGQMQRWEANFGGDSADETIDIYVYSDGQDLDNHLVRGSPFAYTGDVVQTSQDASSLIHYDTADIGGGWNFYGQDWTVGAGVMNLGAISVLLNGTANVTLTVYSSFSSSTPLAVSSQAVSVSIPTEIQFSFPAHITTTPGGSLFLSVTVLVGQSVTIYYSNANPYGGGVMYNNVFAGGGGGGSWVAQSGNDLYFKTFSSNGSTIATFTSVDPTIGMLEPIIDDYNSEGGAITYTSSSIDATGLSLNYGFNVATIYDAIKGALTVSPNGFYYYVDLGTDVLHFKQSSVTADVVLTKGLHMSAIKVAATIEQLVNTVYTTGAYVSGSNIYAINQNAASISLYGPRLERHTDVNIPDTPTAHIVGNSEIAKQKNESYQTVVTVLDKTMDIAMLKPGMVVGFNGFGTFVDGLLAQIVRNEYTSEAATLTLGIVPKRLHTEVEKVTRGLIAASSVNNPISPS